MLTIKSSWTFAEAEKVYKQPFPDLIYQAQSIHRQVFPGNRLQRSALVSIKTGGCTEDCGYCAQSAQHGKNVQGEPLLTKESVLLKAKEAKAVGATRLCLGAAWRGIKNEHDFERVLEIVRAVAVEGLEVCCTLGMLTAEQARRLKEAGCHTYNHNLDTAPDYYTQVITSHTFADRLETIKNVREAGLSLCCGGIVGMGETAEQRIQLLVELAGQEPHPDNVPINMLIPMPGTPLAGVEKLDPFEFVRTIAAARIMMPKSFVRLSAGRSEMSDEMQALCFLAGANSIFTGDKLLTAPNRGEDYDQQLINRLGMSFLEAIS